MSASQTASPDWIYKLDPYTPGKPPEEVERELGITGVIKLASNENPYGPSPAAIAAMVAAARRVHLYPDAAGYALRQAISAAFAVPAEEVLLGNGSAEILKADLALLWKVTVKLNDFGELLRAAKPIVQSDHRSVHAAVADDEGL